MWMVLGPQAAAAQVAVYPGTSIQSQVDAYPAGTTFVLKAGVHANQRVRPKTGNTFTGEAGTVLTGARRLTTFSTAGTASSSTAYISGRSWSSMTNGWGPAEKDRSNGETGTADGRTITLNGQQFSRGIGAHAPSEIGYALDGACTNFSASVGIDDEVGSKGGVTFEVWADGVKLYDSGFMTGDTATKNLSVNVSGKQNLLLIVREGADFYYDHADWADARLTCSGGTFWVASGQTQQGQTHGVCQAQYPRCSSPEEFFIDDVPLTHVSSLAQVRPGTWYFDYGNDRIYFADDPNGRRVETSVTSVAFEPTADNVTISNLRIEKYSNIAQQGVIDGRGRSGWVVTGNDVRLNHGVGIRVGSRSVVRQNKVRNNGQMGVEAGGDGVLIDGNEIANNNRAGFEVLWEGGGTKFVGTTNLTVRGNFVHHNLGPGLWTDIDNIYTVYENNTVEDNAWMGILHEISYKATIRNNTVRRNGFAHPNWVWGGGIVVSSSSDVEVSGNVLDGNADGIGVVQQNRGSGAYGPYQVWNLWVHDNTVKNTDGWTGLVQDVGDRSVFTSRNNWFNSNSYVLDGSSRHFTWMDGELSHTQWRDYGLDPAGSFTMN
jgi:parallel beta-helix repeat protein